MRPRWGCGGGRERLKGNERAAAGASPIIYSNLRKSGHARTLALPGFGFQSDSGAATEV